MSKVATALPTIRSVEFLNSSIMFVHLKNDRTFLVPLDAFPEIRKLSQEDRKDYEIIDETYLSFLAIDEVFSLNDLLGMP